VAGTCRFCEVSIDKGGDCTSCHTIYSAVMAVKKMSRDTSEADVKKLTRKLAIHILLVTGVNVKEIVKKINKMEETK